MCWIKVVFASDCKLCEMCEEPVCPVCDVHYSDCDCPGPTQDDMYEYKQLDNGDLLAKLISDGND